MNYNANSGGKQPFGRKIKRVSDVNSMGYNPNPYDQGSQMGSSNLYPTVGPDSNFLQPGNVNNVPFDSRSTSSTPKVQQDTNFGYNQTPYPNLAQGGISSTPNLGVLNQPVVQDMAFQYGQQLAGVGKTLIKNEVERYVPVTKLKYYFAVDTNYVIQKLKLLFFPFTHKDWSIKYEQDGPIQPRYEINAPDLYIPTMAYITYVFVAGLVLGMHQRFSPEQIGILASSALAWCLVELAVYSCTLYIIHVDTSLKTLDLIAYSGYKFVGIIVSTLVSLLGGRTGYYSCLIYSNLALSFFIVRSLKVAVLTESSQETSYYGSSQSNPAGHKRRLYFLLFVAGVQPLLSWWLSYHLLGAEITPQATPLGN